MKKDLCIQPNTSNSQAMKKLDRPGEKVLFVVDKKSKLIASGSSKENVKKPTAKSLLEL